MKFAVRPTLSGLFFFLTVGALVAACGGSGGQNGGFGNQDGGGGGGSGSDGGPNRPIGALNDGGGGGMTDAAAGCTPSSPDETGCQCTTGQTHACYTGPAGTRMVGACKDGTQTCMLSGEFGHFGPCTGQTLPSPEAGHCTDHIDNDCNGLTDCADPACATDPVCLDAGPPPPPPPPPDAGPQCGPPIISNNETRCPQGTVMNGSGLCCPCTAADCGSNQSCCAAAVCANDPSCASCSGQPLDPICNGYVDQDCNDFPEDCDQLCCPCKPAGLCQACPSGQVPCFDLSTLMNVCTDVTSNPFQCGACDGICNLGQTCVAGLCH